MWLHLDGRPMEGDDWDDGAQAVGMYLNGQGIGGRDARGGPIVDDHFLLYFNADGPTQITLPPAEYAEAWEVVIDTGGVADDRGSCPAGATIELETRSMLVLREYHEPEADVDHSVAASVAAQQSEVAR